MRLLTLADGIWEYHVIFIGHVLDFSLLENIKFFYVSKKLVALKKVFFNESGHERSRQCLGMRWKNVPVGKQLF